MYITYSKQARVYTYQEVKKIIHDYMDAISKNRDVLTDALLADHEKMMLVMCLRGLMMDGFQKIPMERLMGRIADMSDAINADKMDYYKDILEPVESCLGYEIQDKDLVDDLTRRGSSRWKEVIKTCNNKKYYLRRMRPCFRDWREINEEIDRIDRKIQEIDRAIKLNPEAQQVEDLRDYAGRLCAELIRLKKAEATNNFELDEIRKAIMEMANPLERAVLTDYYIMGMTWDEVANKTGYSVRHILNLHGHALQHLRLKDFT